MFIDINVPTILFFSNQNIFYFVVTLANYIFFTSAPREAKAGDALGYSLLICIKLEEGKRWASRVPTGKRYGIKFV